MINNSTEDQPMNKPQPGYDTGSAPGQTAILIENEQLRAENEVARAVITAQHEQNQRRCCSGPGAACGGLITAAIIIYNIFVLFYNASLWTVWNKFISKPLRIFITLDRKITISAKRVYDAYLQYLVMYWFIIQAYDLY